MRPFTLLGTSDRSYTLTAYVRLTRLHWILSSERWLRVGLKVCVKQVDRKRDGLRRAGAKKRDTRAWSDQLVTLPLAYLPQSDFEVIACVLAILIGGSGVRSLIRGAGPAKLLLGSRPGRILSVVAVVVGVALGVAAFTVDAEPRCRGCGQNHWGGTAGIVILCMWLAWMALIVGYRLRHRR
jgi:hypothetical protein